MAVRRSTASTSVKRAGTSGLPARSTRRNTIPCPAGAGRNVASVAAPVCRPVPRTPAGRVTDRLLAGGSLALLDERFELVHDFGQPVERDLSAEELAPWPGRGAEEGRVRRQIGDDARLHEQPRAAP